MSSVHGNGMSAGKSVRFRNTACIHRSEFVHENDVAAAKTVRSRNTACICRCLQYYKYITTTVIDNVCASQALCHTKLQPAPFSHLVRVKYNNFGATSNTFTAGESTTFSASSSTFTTSINVLKCSCYDTYSSRCFSNCGGRSTPHVLGVVTSVFAFINEG